jgi:hypothetical protein
MQIDQNTSNVLLGLFGVANTALLVYQAIRLQSVHTAVNGAKDAAVQAATAAGFMAGSQGSSPPIAPVPKPPE